MFRLLQAVLLAGLFLVAGTEGVVGSDAALATKPRVRAITAFVRLEANQYQAQVQEAVKLLRSAQQAYEQQGFEVQTIRITTQPFPEIIRGLPPEQAMRFFDELQKIAKGESFLLNIGAAVLNENDAGDSVAEFLAKVLAGHDQFSSSIVVADENGVHWKSARAAAKVFKLVSERTPNGQGTFGFAATAMLKPYGPFFPGSYHDGPGHQFAIGLESANVAQAAFSAHSGDIEGAEKDLATQLGRYAVECEKIARSVEQQSGWTYAGLDPTPAPGGDISMGDAIEKLTGKKFGSSGTLAVAAMITRVVKSIPVKQVGYAGLMLPVLEDSLLAQRWSENTFGIDSLLAYSAVCGTGLDTVPLPGEVSEEQLMRIIGDVASLAYKWKKPLSARLQPVPGKSAGQRTAFDNPHLANAVLQKLP